MYMTSSPTLLSNKNLTESVQKLKSWDKVIRIKNTFKSHIEVMNISCE